MSQVIPMEKQQQTSMPPVYGGCIELILGPMFSGKTTELLRRIRRHTCANKKCVVIKYYNDTRYSKDNLATHDMQQWQAIAAKTLGEIEQHELDNYEVIGIDEGQFFQDIVEFCERAANAGKIVIVAALDGTFQRVPFGSVLELIPKAESVVKLTAVCMLCHEDAAFSMRTCASIEVEVIGGSDKYVAVCRKCYHDHATMFRTVNPSHKEKNASSSPATTHKIAAQC